jgi:hypothetical protein
VRIYVADVGGGDLGEREGARHGAEGAVAGGGWVGEVVGVGGGGVGGEGGVDGGVAVEGVVEFLAGCQWGGRCLRGWMGTRGDVRPKGEEGVWGFLREGTGENGVAVELKGKGKGKAYLQHHNPRPLSHHKSIPIPVKRPRGPLRCSIRRRSQTLGTFKACDG